LALLLANYRSIEIYLQRWQNGHCWQEAKAEEEARASQESKLAVQAGLDIAGAQLARLKQIFAKLEALAVVARGERRPCSCSRGWEQQEVDICHKSVKIDRLISIWSSHGSG
jgi:hypothetical protein